jgi:hypothetical protein
VTFQHEELPNLVSLNGTTKGSDIFEAVCNCVYKYGGFDKCSTIVTDGAKALVREQKRFSGLVRKSGVKCPIFHCIIYQETLCGKSVQQSNCMKVVVKITNLFRGGNRLLSHHKFSSFLEEIDASYGDLLSHSQIRWLSAGKCLERFFALRREIPLFLKDEISSDTTDLEQEMLNPTFLCELVFNGRRKTHERLKHETAREAAKCFKFILTCKWIPQRTEVVQNCR